MDEGRRSADALWRLEDSLVPAVKDWGGIFVGRITYNGRRDFVFYGPSATGFDVAVSAALAPFGYEYNTMEDEDPGWEMYFECLYPSEWNWRSIMNRRVIENLTKHGDDLSKPRRVFHWLYFTADADRQRCAAAAKEKGFSAIYLKQAEKPDAARPFGLELHRIDSVSQAEIDAISYELLTLAEIHAGEYDGWETQIVKAGQEPVDDAPPEH